MRLTPCFRTICMPPSAYAVDLLPLVHAVAKSIQGSSVNSRVIHYDPARRRSAGTMLQAQEGTDDFPLFYDVSLAPQRPTSPPDNSASIYIGRYAWTVFFTPESLDEPTLTAESVWNAIGHALQPWCFNDENAGLWSLVATAQVDLSEEQQYDLGRWLLKPVPFAQGFVVHRESDVDVVLRRLWRRAPAGQIGALLLRPDVGQFTRRSTDWNGIDVCVCSTMSTADLIPRVGALMDSIAVPFAGLGEFRARLDRDGTLPTYFDEQLAEIHDRLSDLVEGHASSVTGNALFEAMYQEKYLLEAEAFLAQWRRESERVSTPSGPRAAVLRTARTSARLLHIATLPDASEAAELMRRSAQAANPDEFVLSCRKCLEDIVGLRGTACRTLSQSINGFTTDERLKAHMHYVRLLANRGAHGHVTWFDCLGLVGAMRAICEFLAQPGDPAPAIDG